MAGDWIKMRLDLLEDPAVMEMAEAMDVREEVIVGYCHAFWSWVSRQCHAGSVTGVTLVSLGRRLNLPGFPEQLRDVGWLEYDDSGDRPVITIPKFERHLSQSAKTRANAKDRQRRKRDSCHADVTVVSRSERDKSVTREEKRREEKSTRTKVRVGTRAFVSQNPPSVDEVRAYCQQRGNSIDPERFVDYYTSNGWKVGKNPMKDWKAAIRQWEKSDITKKESENRAIEERNRHKPKPMTGDNARYEIMNVHGVREARNWSGAECLRWLDSRTKRPPREATAQERRDEVLKALSKEGA